MEPAAGPGRADQAGTALIGRAAERDTLSAALDRLAAGRGGVVEMLGEPGAGKTRLLTELRRQAAALGVPALYGRAAEAGRRACLQPFADALVGHPGRQRALDALPAPDAALLGPLLGLTADAYATDGCGAGHAVPDQRGPGARAQGPAGARGPGAPTDAYLAARALHRMLTMLAAEPMVLALDDVHGADPGSLAALDHLLRHPLPAGLLLVVAHRPRQAPLRLRSALAEGADRFGAERIALGPLSITEAAALVEPLPAGRSLHRVYLESQGNPLYLLLSARGRAGGAAAGPGDEGWPDGADRLEERILREADGLKPDECAVIAAATVLGGRFDTDTLAAVSGLDGPAVRAALPALTRRDLLRSARGGGELTFRHPLVRRVLYERTFPAWRVEAHRRVAALLAARVPSPRDRARHLECCAPPWSAQETATVQAAAEAAFPGAPEEAAHWLRLALTMLPAEPADSGDRLRLRHLLARALEHAGRPVESRSLLQDLLPAVRGDASDLHDAVVTLAARVERVLGRYQESEALLRGMLAAAPADPADAEVPVPAQESGAVRATVEARAELALTGLLAGSYPGVRQDADRAAADAVRLGDRALTARTLALRALGEAYEGRTAQAEDLVAEAAGVVAGLADAELSQDCEALYTLGCAEVFLERFTDAERHLNRGELIARHANHHHAHARLGLAGAELQLRTGRVDAALEHLARAERSARRSGSAALIGLARAMREPAALWSRPPAPAGTPSVPAHDPRSRTDPRTGWWAAAGRAWAADAALVGGDPLGCGQTLLHAGGGPGLPRFPPADRPRLFACLALAALATDDRRRAAEYAGRAERAAAALGLTGQRGHATAARAAVLAAGGEHTAAVTGYSEAAACFAAAGLELDQARAHFEAAAVLAAAGRPAEAANALDRARGIAERAGVRRLVARAEELRAELARRPADRGRDPLDCLTAREREVAILVGQGVTSRQAAERLQLSTRTVDSHLARIYHKLGISSRAALARRIERVLSRPEPSGATRLHAGQHPDPAPASMRIA